MARTKQLALIPIIPVNKRTRLPFQSMKNMHTPCIIVSTNAINIEAYNAHESSFKPILINISAE
jgi:hypothetical protein